MTAEQLAEWEAYDRLDPVGEWREDFRMASLAAVITNIAISLYGKPGTSSVQVSEYMPVWDQEELREPKKQSVEEMKNALISWAEQQNKRVKNK